MMEKQDMVYVNDFVNDMKELYSKYGDDFVSHFARRLFEDDAGHIALSVIEELLKYYGAYIDNYNVTDLYDEDFIYNAVFEGLKVLEKLGRIEDLKNEFDWIDKDDACEYCDDKIDPDDACDYCDCEEY